MAPSRFTSGRSLGSGYLLLGRQAARNQAPLLYLNRKRLDSYKQLQSINPNTLSRQLGLLPWGSLRFWQFNCWMKMATVAIVYKSQTARPLIIVVHGTIYQRASQLEDGWYLWPLWSQGHAYACGTVQICGMHAVDQNAEPLPR